ncbi:hypothetical protein F5887DRAFT_947064 [Amanita rubescens]|nr:hypothetical protein F5887DRAFT_947064 [Amanita rubescens]
MPGCLSILFPVLRQNRNERREKTTSLTQDLMQHHQELRPDNASGTTTARTPPRRRDWETERTSSPLDEDFDLMTSSAGATTARGSIYSDPRPLPPEGSYRYMPERSRVYSPDGNKIGNSGPGTQGPSRHSTITRSTSKHGRHGSGSGPQFEVVKSQVVEDGPERTVTVSLWKEQVAKSIGPNGETMSVHYYSAEEVLPNTMYTNETRGRRDEYTPSEAGDTRPVRDIPSSPRDITPSERNYRHRSPQSPGPSLTGNRSDIYYGQSPPRISTPMRPMGGAQSSTPSYSPQPASPSSKDNSPGRIGAQHHGGPDNSISTIKSLPTIEMEKILDSCEPSLVHIAPILACLGITREEHLRAIIRLSEETRDKEVKEEALRLGMTVMEWAILLDKLHSL